MKRGMELQKQGGNIYDVNKTGITMNKTLLEIAHERSIGSRAVAEGIWRLPKEQRGGPQSKSQNYISVTQEVPRGGT